MAPVSGQDAIKLLPAFFRHTVPNCDIVCESLCFRMCVLEYSLVLSGQVSMPILSLGVWSDPGLVGGVCGGVVLGGMAAEKGRQSKK